mgnify:CR=1 FL=1
MCCIINLQSESLLNEVGLEHTQYNSIVDIPLLYIYPNVDGYFKVQIEVNKPFNFQIETEHLFGNISDVISVNCDFWESHLLKVLLAARENRMPLNPSDMKDGFKRVRKIR